jgi:hypothetical protein
MAVTAGILRVLEPGAVPPISGVTLLSIERSATERPEDKLLDLATERAEQDQWQAIVIHDSRSTSGSYDAIDKSHRRAGKDGCGYHLVVNNGTGGDDGRIEVGYRWKYQQNGDYLIGPNADWYHRKAIGICIVGDADHGPFTDAQQRELIWLVRQLQHEFGIRSEHIFVDVGENPDLAARHFSQAHFRSQLLGPTALR